MIHMLGMDERIKVIHKRNTGVSDSRNMGIIEANGKYITFVDSDDYISENMLKIMYKELIENDVDIVICGKKVFDEKNSNIINQKNKTKEILNSEQALKELMLEKKFNCVCWAKLYKTTLFDYHKFSVDTTIAEDLEVLYKIISECKNILLDTTKELYCWNNRQNSATKSQYNKGWKKEMDITNEIIKFMDKNYPKQKKYAEQRYVRISIKCIYKCIDINNMNEAQRILKTIKPYMKIFLFSWNEKIHHKISAVLMMLNLKIFIKLYKIARKRYNR